MTKEESFRLQYDPPEKETHRHEDVIRERIVFGLIIILLSLLAIYFYSEKERVLLLPIKTSMETINGLNGILIEHYTNKSFVAFSIVTDSNGVQTLSATRY